MSPDDNPLIPFQGGTVYSKEGQAVTSGAPANFYETSTPDGEHLSFNGGTRYCIYHRLGRRPFSVEPWLSFSRYGTSLGNEAKPAGNMVEVLRVTDQVIIVRNNSCSDYYLRMLASDPVSQAPAGGTGLSSPPEDTATTATVSSTEAAGDPCGE